VSELNKELEDKVYHCKPLILSFNSLIEKMLVREPYLRSTLESIMADPWFQGGHPPVLPTPVPLVTELPLTPEEHNYVMDTMEAGNIADRDTVQK